MRQALGPGALGRPRGIGWRGRWERGIGMGNTCKPMAVSFQCMTKSTTIEKKKLNIQKTKIMASGPIISWEIDGETVEKVADFIFRGSKITAAMKLKDAYFLEEKL